MVCHWVKRFKEEGIKGIKEKARGGLKGKQRVLTPDTEKLLKQDILDKTPRGKTPVLNTSGSSRTRINMISAINNQGKLRFMIYEGRMDSDRILNFLKSLIQDAQKKVFLIVDNLKVHHSKKVTKWVEEHLEQIELYYLPRYSPERNPDEYLNNDLKTALNQREPSRTKKEMENKIRSHMVKTQRNN